MNLIVKKNYIEMSTTAARTVADFIINNPGSLLCFCAGDTPYGMFEQLIEMQKKGLLDLNSVYYVGLDEWVGVGEETTGSCVQVMNDHFYLPANIKPERKLIFNGLNNPQDECKKIADYIKRHGGIGLTVLGIGMNGHIGFNEPGTDISELCGVVALDDVTKSVLPKYFGRQLPLTQGVTVSTKALSEAKQIILIASGEKKAAIIKKIIGSKNRDIPASLLAHLEKTCLIVDRSAYI